MDIIIPFWLGIVVMVCLFGGAIATVWLIALKNSVQTRRKKDDRKH